MIDIPRLLVIDDDEIHRDVVRRLLGNIYLIEDAETGTEALEKLLTHEYDCVLLDYRLPDYTGLELLPYLVERHLPVVMFTSLVSDTICSEAIKMGVEDYVQKDQMTRETVTRSIQAAIKKSLRQPQFDLLPVRDREPA